MRKSWIIGGLVVAVFAVGISWWRGAPPGPAAPPVTVAEAPPTPDETAPPAPVEPPAAENAAPPPPAAAALPQLPTRAVAEWRTHVVPEDPVPPPPKPLDLRAPSNDAAATSDAPAFRPFASLEQPPSTGGTSTPAARRGTGPQIAGAAEAAGATALRVGGQPLHLFGIRPPATGDRCAAPAALTPGGGAPPGRVQPCLEQAQGLLTARLASKATVSCRFPVAVRQDAPAICLDGDGVDLAGFLVAEGLALADPAQSYDYVGAEDVARAQKRGLWLFR